MMTYLILGIFAIYIIFMGPLLLDRIRELDHA